MNTLLKSPLCVALVATLILFLSSLALAARRYPNQLSDAVVVACIVAGVGFLALRKLVVELNAQLFSAGRTLDEFVLNFGLDCVILVLVGAARSCWGISRQHS